MPRSSYFFQECPTCGRSLQVRVEYLGKQVICRHCRGQFLAIDPASGLVAPSDSGVGLLRRADELLHATGSEQDAREISATDSLPFPFA